MKAIVVVLFAASLVFVTACQKEEARQDEQAKQEKQTQQTETGRHEGHQHEVTGGGETVAAAFYCPMKCEGEKTYADAGTCPTCNMDLVEVEDEDTEAGTTEE